MDLSLADVLIAGLAAILGWFVASRSYQAAIDQYRLSAATAAADWIHDLRSWASEAIDVLAEAACHSPRWSIAAVYFSPMNEAIKWSSISLQHRGLLHAAIDPLVAAEKLLGGEANRWGFPDRKAALIGV